VRHWAVRAELLGPPQSYLSQAELKLLTFELAHLRPLFEGWPTEVRLELHVVAEDQVEAVSYAQTRVAFALRVADREDWSSKIVEVTPD
jgi:hypothetical protein